MIKLKKHSLIFSVFILIILSFMGCSSNSKTSKDTNSSKSSTSSDNKKTDVLNYYKKVDLGMTKDQVGSTLALKPEAKTGKFSLPNSFDYLNHDTGYGLYVLYNSKNVVYSKFYICGDYSEIAKLCKNSVNENQVSKITKNMDYKEVITILGGEGVECGTSADENNGNVIGVSRMWANKDGSYILVLFSKDNKVTVANYIS